MNLTKNNVIKFLRNLNITVKTNTKARGNNGIYLKNRIDIASNLNEDKAIEVLVHEFAHYIHSKLEKNFVKTGGSLEILFNTPDTQEIKSELVKITAFIDKNAKLETFINHKKEIASTIKSMQKTIQNYYPNFQRSKKFVEFEKYIKHSDAKFLLKYDAIRIVSGFIIKKTRTYTVNNIELDFPNMPKAFQLYIKLHSLKRKQSKISRRICKLNKYYNSPTELFARFVQCWFFDNKIAFDIAPIASSKFKRLLEEGYYQELKDFFNLFMCNIS